jgi:intracellular sulfur oxidation DsrE/DsrF family protein
MSEEKISTQRRGFLEGVIATAAAAGLSGLTASSPEALAADATSNTNFQRWLAGIQGKHKQVYDMPEVNHGAGLVWSWIFQLTGAPAYGVSEKDLGVVVVLRHNAIPLALNDSQWEKYPLGEYFKIDDPATGNPATRNPFHHVKAGEFFPEAALENLIAKGVKVGACNMAIMYYSGEIAKKTGGDAETIRKDWLANVFPGVDVVPSGVLALNGAQAAGCAYVAAG